MLCRKYLLVVLLPVFLGLFSVGTIWAQQESEDILPLVLDMYKFDQYLPAIDILEANEKTQSKNPNYWIYLGLAYQRTEQLNKALDSYKKASVQNKKSASNLETRIANLKKTISKNPEYVMNDLSTNMEKADWLFAEAEKKRLDPSNRDKAFRIFLQAVEYNINYLSNDKDFVRSGSVYYRLKMKEKMKYAELFYAAFSFYENEISEAYNYINSFRNSSSEKSLAIQRMEDYYYKKIVDASNELKEFTRAENELAAYKKQEAEKKKAAEKIEKQNKKKSQKTDEDSDKTDIRAIESDIQGSNFAYRDSFEFSRVYAQEMAKRKTEDYFATSDMKAKKMLIWEMAQSGSQDPRVMEAVCDALKQDNIEMVVNAVDAIHKIGMPSAAAAMPSLLELLDSERGDFRFFAVKSLSRLGINPEVVVPKVISKYSSEDNEFLRKQYSNCVDSFGKAGLDVAYKLLDDSPRVERLPIARFISSITGEKVDSLINR